MRSPAETITEIRAGIRGGARGGAGCRSGWRDSCAQRRRIRAGADAGDRVHARSRRGRHDRGFHQRAGGGAGRYGSSGRRTCSNPAAEPAVASSTSDTHAHLEQVFAEANATPMAAITPPPTNGASHTPVAAATRRHSGKSQPAFGSVPGIPQPSSEKWAKRMKTWRRTTIWASPTAKWACWMKPSENSRKWRRPCRRASRSVTR